MRHVTIFVIALMCLSVSAVRINNNGKSNPDGFKLVSHGEPKPLDESIMHHLRRRAGIADEKAVGNMRFQNKNDTKRDAKQTTTNVHSSLSNLIEKLREAQKEEDEAFEVVVRKCNASESVSEDTIRKMKETLPDQEKFRRQKNFELEKAQDVVDRFVEAKENLESQKVSAESREALVRSYAAATSFLSLSETHRSVPDADHAPMAPLQESLNSAKEGAGISFLWHKHLKDVFDRTTELKETISDKCSELHKKYQSSKEARNRQIASLRSVMETLSTIPVAAGALDTVDEDLGSEQHELRFRSSASSGSTSFQIRRSREIAEVMQGYSNETQSELKNIETNFKSAEARQKKELEDQASAEQRKRERKIAIKLALGKSEASVKELQKSRNDALDEQRAASKECETTKTLLDQASGNLEIAAKDREDAEREILEVGSDDAQGSSADWNTQLDIARGALAKATALKNSALSGAEEAEAKVKSLERKIESNEDADEKAKLEQDLQSAKNVLSTKSDEASSRAQETVHATANLNALREKIDAMRKSSDTRAGELKSKLVSLQRKEQELVAIKADREHRVKLACDAAAMKSTRADDIQKKLIAEMARLEMQKERLESVDSDDCEIIVPDMRVIHPCGLYQTAVECTEDDMCGWIQGEEKRCEIGTMEGPLVGELKESEVWIYQYVKDALCSTIKTCFHCLRQEQCGYYGKSGMCTDGGPLGPNNKALTAGDSSMCSWLHKNGPKNEHMCPAQKIVKTDKAIAQDEARRVYMKLSTALASAQASLFDALRSSNSSTTNDDDDDGVKSKEHVAAMTREVAKIRKRWGEARTELQDAVKGVSRSFYAGFAEGLAAGERKAAEKAGYLEGLKEVLSLFKSSSSVGVGVSADAPKHKLALMRKQIEAASKGVVGETELSGAVDAERNADELAQLAADGPSTMRLAATDAQLTSRIGLEMAAEATDHESFEIARSHTERLNNRIAAIRARLKSGEGITDEEAKLIAAKFNGAKEAEARLGGAPRRRMSEDASSGKLLKREMLGQAALPSAGESESNFSPNANGAEKIAPGENLRRASVAAHRDVDPGVANVVTKSAARFKGVQVSVVDDDAAAVETKGAHAAFFARRAADMQKKQRDDLEGRSREAAIAAASMKEKVSRSDRAERDATIALESVNVELQLKSQALQQARADRDHAMRAASVHSGNDDAQDAAAKQLQSTETEVERALEEFERVKLAAEQKQKIVDEASSAASEAREKLSELQSSSNVLRDAFAKADASWTALNDAAGRAEKAASAASAGSYDKKFGLSWA